MELSTFANGDRHIVKVAGQLTDDSLLGRLPSVVEQVVCEALPAIVELDIAGVEIIDMEGIGAILQARQRAIARGSQFILVEGRPQVRRRLEISGLLPLLEGRKGETRS